MKMEKIHISVSIYWIKSNF